MALDILGALRRARADRRPSSTPAPGTPEDAAADAAPTSGRPSRARVLRTTALATTLVLVGGGSVAVASAHKTIALDVDGEVTEVTTYAGSVDGLLEEAGVEVGDRDVVAPGGTAALGEGDEVVVRHARQVTVLTDGQESRLWTTALSAEDVLVGLRARGDDVRLVASRSAATGRAELPGELDLSGRLEVVVDGDKHAVADGSAGLDAVLADLGVEVGELDRVSVHRPADVVRVTVQRVVAEERDRRTWIAHKTVKRESDELYKGETRVGTEGRRGVRTIVERVVLVDGKEESRVLLSDEVTRKPRTEVVLYGTQERPVVEPESSDSDSDSGSGSGGSGGGDDDSYTPSGDVWARLAQCESGGNPSIVSSNGLYHGLYQFSVGTWQSVGGSGLPSQASPSEQTKRAKMLQARSGWGQWPHCAAKLGLL